MSYLHCPTCKCAYNIAQTALCPNCPVPASEVDPTEDILMAAEQLARAMARATPSERQAAAARMDQLALQLVTQPPPVAKPQPLLAALAYAVVERISDRLPSRLRRVGSRVRARVRALAA